MAWPFSGRRRRAPGGASGPLAVLEWGPGLERIGILCPGTGGRLCARSHSESGQASDASPQGTAAGWTCPRGLPGTFNIPRHTWAQHPLSPPLVTHLFWTHLQETKNTTLHPLGISADPQNPSLPNWSPLGLSLPIPATGLCSGIPHCLLPELLPPPSPTPPHLLPPTTPSLDEHCACIP